jgi:site-specific DNA recombinase
MTTPVSQAGLYARVSTEPQVEAGTIESQITLLKQQAARDGHSIAPEYQFIDDGYSGSTLLRPALERLRDIAAAGSLDRLYVHSPDRLARRYAYQVLLVDELQRAGVDLIFLNRPVSQSAEDDLPLQIQGVIAEYERAQIMERSRRGKRHAAQSGQVSVLSGAPYGYRYIRKADGGGQARYEVVTEHANVVTDIFTWFVLERLGLAAIARHLEELAIRSPTEKTHWDRTEIWTILSNPA